MAERNPLVAGGTHKGLSSLPKTFVTHTFPAIHENTIIVAATHPTIQTGDQTKDGWFLSDFYAFNYLLNGSVADQTWLTAAKPGRLVEKYGNFLHGSPDRDRKVVLSRDLLDSGITPVTLVEPAKMIDRFLSEVNEASLRAKNSGYPLLLMVFCHGVEGYYLCLNNGTRHKGISIVQLKAALQPGVSVTLFTTACFSGGWAVTPELNTTTMAAAKPDDKSISWRLSSSIGRACGSVFAGATISALSDASTPLLGQGSSSEAPTADETCLQPREPTEMQVEMYNEFCRSITDVLGARGFSRILSRDFTFSAQDDKWEYSWTRRSGIPLAHFRERWEKLPTYFYQPNADNNQTTPAAHLTGGADANTVIDEITHSMAQSRVTSMAKLFFEVLCPGDWNRGQDVAVAGGLFQFLHNHPDAQSASEIADIICFRWDTCLLVDRFVDDYGLYRPDGKICVMWDAQEYPAAMEDKYGREGWSARYSPVWRALLEGGAMIRSADNQGPVFYRPLAYMASAVAETCTTEKETKRMVREYCEYVTSIRKFHLDRAIESTSVRSRGRKWLGSIGRGLRRSLSPSKSLCPSTAVRPSVSETDNASPRSKKLGKAPNLY
ncbi:hypothetical protein B0T25DRAFT_481571 [Lasiosphaeria hispida]|uniref:Uncharacterized protein n=1 Tax=Lasiosphaeria hispida TaxID=260671 RepID=A0AAJ0HE01_9PEZI|nr:hypothetical protein B0T25DRAFT_481571 [Lasiosphaeria hispida]